MISNKAYDILKWVALIALDAVGVCYKTLADIWSWPFGVQVLGTCAALAVCLGTLLGISSVQYNRKKADENAEEKDRVQKENDDLRELLGLMENYEDSEEAE